MKDAERLQQATAMLVRASIRDLVANVAVAAFLRGNKSEPEMQAQPPSRRSAARQTGHERRLPQECARAGRIKKKAA